MKKKYQQLVNAAKKAYTDKKYKESYTLYLQAFDEKVDIEDYISFGFVCIELESYGRAQKVFDDVLGMLPHFRAFYGKAVIFEHLGQVDQAISYYETAIKEEPEIAQIYFDCAYLYDDIGQTDKAINFYKLAITLEENHYWAHLNLGAIYERSNQTELAKNYFHKAESIDASMPMVNFNLGVVYAKMNDFDKAEVYYLKELESKEPFALTYFNLGLLYKDYYQDYDKAKLYYLKGLELDRNHYTLWYNLGCLYVLMHDYDNAYDCFFYLVYKQRKFIEEMANDEELEPFLSSSQYQDLMTIVNKLPS